MHLVTLLLYYVKSYANSNFRYHKQEQDIYGEVSAEIRVVNGLT